MQSISEMIQPIKWHEEQLHLLDQRLLPLQKVWLRFEHTDDVTNAIRDMVVRGAPAIGVTAAYAVVLASREAWNKAGVNWKQAMFEPFAKLAASRPTAVNLSWAIEKMTATVCKSAGNLFSRKGIIGSSYTHSSAGYCGEPNHGETGSRFNCCRQHRFNAL